MNEYNRSIHSADVVLVEIYAQWCHHCQRMIPIVHKLKKELQNEVLVLQYDIDENQELSQSLNVETIPTFLLYRNSKEVWRHSGEIEFTNLLNSIEVY